MSFRIRTLLLVLVPVLPAVGITLLTTWQVRDLARAEADERVAQIAALVRHDHDLVNEKAELLLRSLVRHPAVLEPDEGPEECAAALDAVAEPARFLGFLRVDDDGRVLCRTAGSPEIAALPEDSQSARFLATLTEPGAFEYWGAYLSLSARPVGLHGVALGPPGGERDGALLAYSSLAQIEDHMGVDWSPGTRAMLVGKDGRVVLHLPAAPDMVGTEVLRPRTLRAGAPPPAGDAIAATLGISSTPVVLPVLSTDGGEAAAFVIAAVSEDARLGSIAWIVTRNLGVLGVLILLALGLAHVWSRRSVVGPVERLAEAVRRIGSGEFDARVGDDGMPGELGLLARSFDRTVESLEEERRSSEEAREALARQEARYRFLFQHSPFPMWVYDLETLRFLAVNEAAVEEYGYSAGEFAQMTIRDIRSPEDLERLEESVEADRTAGDRSLERSGTWRHRRRDGTVMHVQIRSHPIELDGRPGRLLLAIDVSDRIEMERDLQETRKRFEQLMLHTQDVIWIQDAHSLDLIYVSPAFERIWGIPAEDLQEGRRRFVDTIHPDDRKATRGRDEVPGDFLKEEYRIVRPDGEVRWILDRSFPIRDAEGKIHRVAGIASDLTDRRRLEERLRGAQRLQAVGRLAGGVAHDFNNLLTVVRGHLHLVLEEGELAKGSKAELQAADSAARRAGQLVGQLLAFSRKQVLLPRTIDLNETLRAVQPVLARVVPEGVRTELETAPGDPSIRVDRIQLEQVLLNLAVNAGDAMPEGGTLTVRALTEQVGRGLPAERALSVDGTIPEGDYVVLEVEDDGVGMTDEVRSRAFEPFYTTKEPGRGTGLGLAMVFGVIKQSEGFLQLRSVPGRGTLFRILFPPAEIEAEGGEAVASGASPEGEA